MGLSADDREHRHNRLAGRLSGSGPAQVGQDAIDAYRMNCRLDPTYVADQRGQSLLVLRQGGRVVCQQISGNADGGVVNDDGPVGVTPAARPAMDGIPEPSITQVSVLPCILQQ